MDPNIVIPLLSGGGGAALGALATLLGTGWQMRQARALDERSMDEARRSAAWGSFMPFLVGTAERLYRLNTIRTLLGEESWAEFVHVLLDGSKIPYRFNLENDARELVREIAQGFCACVPELVGDDQLRTDLIHLQESITSFELYEQQSEARVDSGIVRDLIDVNYVLDQAKQVVGLDDLVKEIHAFVASNAVTNKRKKP